MEEFDLNEKGDFQADWNGSVKFSKMSLNELILALISEVKANLHQYATIVQNDGKLIGNEKIILIRSLGDLIQIFTFTRNYIQKHFAKGKYSNSKLSITMRNETDFTVRGNLNLADIENFNHFGDWQKKVLSALIEEFREEIKKSLEDKMITEEEGNQLCSSIDKAIYQILIASYKLNYKNLVR